MKLPVPHITSVRFTRTPKAAIIVDGHATWHRCSFLIVASLAICAILLLAMLLSYTPLSQQRISLSGDCHIRFWAGRIWFFNDADDGPYRGSIISVSGGGVETGSPPAPTVGGWGDAWGIYYRHFRWPTGETLWTLAVTLWYGIGLTALPPVVWWVWCYFGDARRGAVGGAATGPGPSQG